MTPSAQPPCVYIKRLVYYPPKTNTLAAIWAKWGLAANPLQRKAVLSSQLSGTLYQPCLPSSASMHFDCDRLLQLSLYHFSLWLVVCHPLDTGKSLLNDSIGCSLPPSINGMAVMAGSSINGHTVFTRHIIQNPECCFLSVLLHKRYKSLFHIV